MVQTLEQKIPKGKYRSVHFDQGNPVWLWTYRPTKSNSVLLQTVTPNVFFRSVLQDVLKDLPEDVEYVPKSSQFEKGGVFHYKDKGVHINIDCSLAGITGKNSEGDCYNLVRESQYVSGAYLKINNLATPKTFTGLEQYKKGRISSQEQVEDINRIITGRRKICDDQSKTSRSWIPFRIGQSGKLYMNPLDPRRIMLQEAVCTLFRLESGLESANSYLLACAEELAIKDHGEEAQARVLHVINSRERNKEQCIAEIETLESIETLLDATIVHPAERNAEKYFAEALQIMKHNAHENVQTYLGRKFYQGQKTCEVEDPLRRG